VWILFFKVYYLGLSGKNKLYKGLLFEYFMGKVISVVALKGGVGKTSSVVALGSALADFKQSVLLVDANLSAPNLGYHLNIIDPEITLHDVLARTANIKDAIYEFNEKFHVLPASMFSRVKVNPLKLKDKLSYWKKKYDYVIIDSSPALNDETLAAMLAADEIFVVTTPDLPTLSTTLKAVKLARQRDTPIVGLILNKVHNKNFELSLKDIEETSEVPVMAVVPYDINVLKALSKFIPSVDHKPKSEVAQEFLRLAGSLVGREYKPARKKRFLRWLNPRKQDLNRQVYYSSFFGN